MSDTVTRSAWPGEPIRREDSRPQFCVECGLSFGIVDRHPDFPSTCEECVDRLPALSVFGECEWCHKAILRGTKIHLRILKLCQDCRDWDEATGYEFDTEAW